MPKRRYKLMKSVATISLVGAISLTLNTHYYLKNNSVSLKLSGEDTIYNVAFSEELACLYYEEEVCFKNQELYKLVREQTLGKVNQESLRSISVLDIGGLQNSDLSDLKYLPNLGVLQVHGMDVDCLDLQYNQNLICLNLEDGTIANTEVLPNSIATLLMSGVKCDSQDIVVPYCTTNLVLNNCIFKNIVFKGKLLLEHFTLIGDAMLDLGCLEGCLNLKEINLRGCSNLKNVDVLTTFKELDTVTLDDYATIYLNSKILSKLPVLQDEKESLKKEIRELERIVASLGVDKNATDEEKIEAISLYILEHIQYDVEVLGEQGAYQEKVYYYNTYPIRSVLEGSEGICINYACFFKALANRLGLDSYQLFSEEHTWNAVRMDDGLVCYDLTMLDDSPIVKMNGKLAIVLDATVEELIRTDCEEFLYYYGFFEGDILDKEHMPKYLPEVLENFIYRLGFVSEKSVLEINEFNKLISGNKNSQAKVSAALSVFCVILYSYALGKEAWLRSKEQDWGKIDEKKQVKKYIKKRN